MANQIWLINGSLFIAILREGEQQTTVSSPQTGSPKHISCFPHFHIPAHTGKMKAKNRDQSLSDSRELDGSYDQLTGE